jgi:hypothetical protein
MQPVNRPTSVLVIAILQFIFAGLWVLIDLCGGAAQLSGGSPGMGGRGGQAEMQMQMQRDIEAAAARRLPSYKAVSLILVLLDLVLCGIMIGGGVGLMQMQPWGRTLTIVYALFSLVMKVAQIAFAALVTGPATKEVVGGMAEMGREGAFVARVLEISTSIGAWMPVCFAIYPVVVLVIMLQPHVAAAFAEARTGPSLGWPGGAQPPDYRDRYPPGGEPGA